MLGITDYLWRLLPGNPILLRVVETGGRRRRDLFIRCGYLGLLILLVLLSLYGADVSTTDLASLAKTSAGVFQSLSYLQLGLVALLAPIFTAGAITQEKDSQTYDILLCTPLSNGQIVLGSLLSRLFFVVILLVSGIPIFSITQIFGGVLIKNIITSFLIATVTAFVTGAMAMAIATFKVGTRRTIFSFYMFIVVYLVGVGLLDRMEFFHPIIGTDVDGSGHPVNTLATTSWLTGIHPFLALRTIFADKAYTPPEFGSLPAHLKSWPIGWYLSNPASFYITAMFVFSLVLVLPSIVLLRWVAQTNLPVKTWALAKLHLAKADRTRRPRTVWANPIAWREAKTKASAAKAGLLRYTFIAAGLVGAVFLVYRFSSEETPALYILKDSYNEATHTLKVTSKTETHAYSVVDTTPVTIKSSPTDTPGRQGTVRDLGGRRYAVTIDANPDNTLAAVTVMPWTRQLGEGAARDYLLGATVLEFAVVLLIVTNAAASAVTREKEDGTLDLLLTTPITSRYYIWGKLRGLVIFVLPLLAVPAASVLLFVLYDLFRVGTSPGDEPFKWIAFPETVLLMPAMLVIVTAFAAILGMRMSLQLRTTVMAVMSSVGIVIGICGLLGFCGYKFLDMRDSTGGIPLFVGSFSPFTLLTLLINPWDFAEHAFTDPDTSGNRLTIAISTLVAVGVYTAVVWGMYTSMVKNFDMTIRRQQR
jgi:ABC-type transport system involved in multi-copper enzyme maturation permease subunit